MTVNPLDYRVVGSSGKIQVAPSAASGSEVVARFVTLTPQPTASCPYILFDVPTGTGIAPGPDGEFDDIGFASDYNTSGSFFLTDPADYYVEVFCELDPPGTLFEPFTAVLTVYWGFGSVNEQVSQPSSQYVDMSLHVSSYRRITSARVYPDSVLQVGLCVYGSPPIDLVISNASIVITKRAL